MPRGSAERRIAIVLDEQVISSPAVAVDVACGVGITGGSTIITGGFTEEEAKELAALIQGGALPVPVEIVEQGTIGPSLGGVETMVSPLALMGYANLSPEERERLGIRDELVRLCCGIEETADLIADLQQALAVI